MPSQASLRRTLLVEVFRRSGADTERAVSLSEVAEALKLSNDDAAVIARQVAGKRWIKFYSPTVDPKFVMVMTMRGIEEAERMEKPFLKRWPSDHPLLFGVLMSIITGIVMLVAGKMVSALWKTLGLD
jgi:hypothetical protein